MCYHLCAVEFRGQGRPLGVLSRRIPCREQLTCIYIYIYVYRMIHQTSPHFFFNNKFIQNSRILEFFHVYLKTIFKMLEFFMPFKKYHVAIKKYFF